ncbi:acyl-CoA thioesterase domain-containing protein [Blastococcus sp. SYSU DS0617]
MRPAYFTLTDDGFAPGESAKSWWVPGMIHGRLLAGLLARELETSHGDPEFQFSRLTVDMFRNAPFEPVQVSSVVVRQGRRIRVTEATVTAGVGAVARASAVQLRRGEQPPSPVPTRTPPWDAPDPGTLPRSVHEFGDEGHPARRRMWIKEKSPLVDGETLSPFVRAALAADMASPLAHRSEDELEFINADYTLTLSRDPVGDHIGLESGGHASEAGVAVGHCAMHDTQGPIGYSMAVAVANIRNV